MPFPLSSSTTKSTSQPTPSAEIDLETLLSRTALLRATLSSQNQSCKLLKAQIKREQSAFRREKAELRGLEDGVQRSKEAAARQGRNLHNLARTLDIDVDADDAGAQQGPSARFSKRSIDDDDDRMDALVPTAARKRQKRRNTALTNEVIEQDTDLAPLVKQLRSHLSSMQSNAASLTSMRTVLGQGERAMMRLSSRITGESARRR
jgi:kinetochore protein Fta7